jgi:hypothetical protein
MLVVRQVLPRQLHNTHPLARTKRGDPTLMAVDRDPAKTADLPHRSDVPGEL